jgi:hypothetical protein
LRALLLFVTAISVVLGTYSLFEVIGASLALAVIGGVMYQTGMKYNNIPFSAAGFFLSLTMSLLTIAWLFNWLILGEGPIYWQRNWPPELRKMARFTSSPHRIIARRDTPYRQFRKDFRWRLSLSPEQHAALVQEYGWEVMPTNEVPADFWQGFPALWRPRQHSASLYHRAGHYVSFGFYSSDECYYSMYDPERQQFFVQCKSVPP